MSARLRRGTIAASDRTADMTPTTRASRTAATRNEPDSRHRLKVGVIGAGRVGSVIGAALDAAGHRVVAASAVSAASLARRAARLPRAELRRPDRVGAGVDVILLAVPDDTLPGLVEGLAEAGAITAGQIVAHTSGSHGLAVLAPAVLAGARPLALHPAMTFSGGADDEAHLAAGISFGVTAPDDLRPLATRLVADLGGYVEWIAEGSRPLYHAALAHGANHLSTLVNEAMDRLRDAGVVHPERVFGPLLHASLDNTLAHGDAALTGPIARGDAGTVGRHVATIAAVAPDSLAVYLALARRTADRAIASGRLSATDAEPLLDVLAQAVPSVHSEVSTTDQGAA